MGRILVVDDSWFQRKQIAKILKTCGHEMTEAVDGKDAVEKALGEKPDCMLLDLLMPEMNGIQVLEFLQKEESDIPVIVLSADIQDTTRARCFELGVKEFINKPVGEKSLRDALDTVLGEIFLGEIILGETEADT